MVHNINALDTASVIGRFARHCVAKNISVVEVTRHFGVSRTVVYNWFKGVYSPRPRHQERMEALMSEVL